MSRKTLSSNMEDYLEAIAILKKEKSIVRVKDVSDILGVKKPSVSGALKVLSLGGFIIHKKYGDIGFTKKGARVASKVYQKHITLVEFLNEVLGVDLGTASNDACKMEHSISAETLEKLGKFIKTLKKRDKIKI